MSKKAKGRPWHSKDSAFYHDNSRCPEGKRTPQRLDGTGQKPHCLECGRLNGSSDDIKAKIRRGIDELDRGEGIPEDKLDAHLAKLRSEAK